MKRKLSLLISIATVLATACTSTPVHYHTLVPIPVNAAVVRPESSYRVDVAPVKIPAQVDRSELVVRQKNGEIALLDNELWIAPLSDELRSAMSVEIIRQLASADAHDALHHPATISVGVDIERFESAPGDYVLIEAFWHLSVSSAMRRGVLACRARAFERVPNGYVALVSGHQRAVAVIADEVATAALRLIAENVAVCPATVG